jgi:hypothetical protein
MEERIKQLEDKVAELQRRLTALEMGGAGHANEGLTALRNELLKKLVELERRIPSKAP